MPAAHQRRSRGAGVQRGLEQGRQFARPLHHRAEHGRDIGGPVRPHCSDGGDRKGALGGIGDHPDSRHRNVVGQDRWQQRCAIPCQRRWRRFSNKARAFHRDERLEPARPATCPLPSQVSLAAAFPTTARLIGIRVDPEMTAEPTTQVPGCRCGANPPATPKLMMPGQPLTIVRVSAIAAVSFAAKLRPSPLQMTCTPGPAAIRASKASPTTMIT